MNGSRDDHQRWVSIADGPSCLISLFTSNLNKWSSLRNHMIMRFFFFFIKTVCQSLWFYCTIPVADWQIKELFVLDVNYKQFQQNYRQKRCNWGMVTWGIAPIWVKLQPRFSQIRLNIFRRTMVKIKDIILFILVSIRSAHPLIRLAHSGLVTRRNLYTQIKLYIFLYKQIQVVIIPRNMQKCISLAPHSKKRLSQMRTPLAACREPAGSYNRLPYVLYVFEPKTLWNGGILLIWQNTTMLL